MKAKIAKLLSEDFIKNNLIFFVGSLLLAFFNYLYYPVLGRVLSVEHFGETQAIISLFIQISIFLTAFGYATVNIVANKKDTSKEKLTVLTELERVALGIGLVILAFLFIFNQSLKTTLNFESSAPFIGLGVLILITVPFTFKNFFLQGRKKLMEVSIAGVLFSVSKLLLSVLFVYLGLKTFGAIFGYILGQSLALLYVYAKTKNNLPSARPRIPLFLSGKKLEKERAEISREIKFSIFIFIMLVTVTLLYSVDAILVRKYFTATEAGLYSGITTIARIVYFVTASISGVLLASVTLSNKEGENKKLLLKSIALITLIGGGCLVVFSAAPELITKILIGEKYLTYASLLPILSFSMLLTSLINLIFTYQIAHRDYSAILPPIIGLAVLALLSVLNHATLLAVIFDLIASNTVIILLSAGLIFIRRNPKWQKRSQS